LKIIYLIDINTQNWKCQIF